LAKDLSTAISVGEEALGAGEILIENFKNLNVKTKKRPKVQASKKWAWHGSDLTD
jgi:hypothetical protein